MKMMSVVLAAATFLGALPALADECREVSKPGAVTITFNDRSQSTSPVVIYHKWFAAAVAFAVNGEASADADHVLGFVQPGPIDDERREVFAVVVDDRGCVVAEGPLALTQWLIRKRAAGLSPYRWGEATESPAAPFGPPEERN